VSERRTVHEARARRLRGESAVKRREVP